MKRLGIWMAALLMLLALPVQASGAEMQEVLIPVSVTAEGAVQDADYTVELTALTPGCPMPVGSIGNVYRMDLKSTGEIRIPCDTLGVYDYRIRQVPGEDPACTYDPREYRLRLFVTTEDGETAVTALIYGQEGTKVPEVHFRNYWAQPAEVVISALKTLDGRTPEDGQFSFLLISETGEVLHEVRNLGRHVTFPVLRFDRPGIYRYFLKEVKGSGKKIIYDRTVYTVTVEVTLDGDYRAAVTYERNGKPFFGTPSFANYTDTGSPKTGDIIGRWFAAMILSAAGLLGIGMWRKRKRR